MKEIWIDVPGFEGLYQVSNTGRIKSFKKSSKHGCQAEHFLKPTLASNGYYQVTLYGELKKKKFQVHRLIAQCFIPNPENLPQINHKDENPANNSADNLEWCTAAYNSAYGTARLRMMITKSKMVEQYLPSGQFLARYVCSSIAQEITGISHKLIQQCCSGSIKSACGYVWRYVEE